MVSAFRPDGLQLLPLWIVVVVSGFASLGLEIVWFRLMLQFVIATTEAFTAMLATVLGGIAIGGLIAAWLPAIAPRSSCSPRHRPGPHRGGGGCQHDVSSWTVEQGWKTMSLWPAVVAILPPSICMGIGFPLALGIAGRKGSDPDIRPRRDDVGVRPQSALGSAGRRGEPHRRVVFAERRRRDCRIAAGRFRLLAPSWQRQGADCACGNVCGIGGLVVCQPAALDRRRRHGRGVCLVGSRLSGSVQGRHRSPLRRSAARVLAARRRANGGQRARLAVSSVLYLDGLHQANDQPDMVRLHRAIGHLPMVLHGNPKDVLVVGMGGGATPGAVSQYPGAQIQIVELPKASARRRSSSSTSTTTC